MTSLSRCRARSLLRVLPKTISETAVVVALAVAIAVAGVAPAGATPLEDATAKVQAAQAAADAAAARYEEALTRLEELGAQVDALAVQIQADKEEVAALRAVARKRAAEAYASRDALAGEGFLSDDDPLDDIRREKLLATTKARDDAAARRLAAITEDLARQRAELETSRAEQAALLEGLEVEQAAVQTQLGEAQQALTVLEEYLRTVEEAEKARELAAEVARAASSRNNGRDYTGVPVTTGIVCPIRGAVSFIDSWGAPRHQGAHKGVDLMAATGTPNVAVVSGTVSFRSGGTSGLGAYLQGDDGTLYYYFHLSAYEGGGRRVAQGEVIGYVGNTGDARYTAPHTHFEIHPGGGAAVNPYPSVRAVC
jgi:murein DD-endopeptidase MepM/ murein hydrolase activator NlpD